MFPRVDANAKGKGQTPEGILEVPDSRLQRGPQDALIDFKGSA
jgi:hypothetical protein